MNKYIKQLFDVDENVITTADLAPAISIDHTSRLASNINRLREIMNISDLTPVNAGDKIKIYGTTVTPGAGQAAEGDTIALSKVEIEVKKEISLPSLLDLKEVTIQAIQRFGRESAINRTDTALIEYRRGQVKKTFFSALKEGTGVAEGGDGLQAAAASAWGELQVLYEDKDFTPVFFVNPRDVAVYLGQAQITVQQSFGFSYVENFLGMGNAIIDPNVQAGEVWATASENLAGAYAGANSDAFQAFELTTDESGLIGMRHNVNVNNGTLQTMLAAFVVFYPENLAGIVKAPIGAELGIKLNKSTETVVKDATVTLTATTVPSGVAVEWESSDETKATVADGVVTGVAAGSANITATAEIGGVEYTATCAVTVTNS